MTAAFEQPLEDNCYWCRDALDARPHRRLSCGHALHAECYGEAFSDKLHEVPRCALCRRVLPEIRRHWRSWLPSVESTRVGCVRILLLFHVLMLMQTVGQLAGSSALYVIRDLRHSIGAIGARGCTARRAYAAFPDESGIGWLLSIDERAAAHYETLCPAQSRWPRCGANATRRGDDSIAKSPVVAKLRPPAPTPMPNHYCAPRSLENWLPAIVLTWGGGGGGEENVRAPPAARTYNRRDEWERVGPN